MQPLGPLVAPGQFFVASNYLTVIHHSKKSVVCYIMHCDHVLVPHSEMVRVRKITNIFTYNAQNFTYNYCILIILNVCPIILMFSVSKVGIKGIESTNPQ